MKTLRTKLVVSVFLLVTALILQIGKADAQTGHLNRYTTTTFNGNFNSIVGGLGTVTIAATGGDDVAYGIAMPFAFN